MNLGCICKNDDQNFKHAEVDSHPFRNDAMLFMDWRDSHLSRYPQLRESNSELPTFLYAMPFSDTRIFFEETSLVARPGLPFEELKDRLYARLKHLGVNVCSTAMSVWHAMEQAGS